MNKQSKGIILGWPISVDSKVKTLHPMMAKRSQQDISYAIEYDGDGHLVTFAPTGSGKGVGSIIPNLLNYDGPTIVIDPKGENFSVTARYRKERLGQRIFLLDPFNAVQDNILHRFQVEKSRLNPLDLCLLSTSGIEDDSQMLPNLFSGPVAFGTDPFWDISARKIISGLIASEVALSKKEKRPPKFSNIISTIFGKHPDYQLATILDDQDPSPFVLSSIGGGYLVLEHKTRSGILATAQSYLSTMMSEDLVYWLDEPTISLSDIQSTEDYTLYIVLPPNKLVSHSTTLAVWVGVLMHTIMERKVLPKRRTLFMLDECANLGSLDTLKKAVTLLRGYGLQVWMFFQDLAQMKHLYGDDHKTMINNCGVLQAFGIGRRSAAQPIASIVGGYRATDILKLDRTQQILSMSPGKVLLAKLMKYYSDPAFNGRFEKTPIRFSTNRKDKKNQVFAQRKYHLN